MFEITQAQRDFIDENLGWLTQNRLNTSCIVEATDPSLLSVLYWHPLVSEKLTLYCPEHQAEILRDEGAWSHDYYKSKKYIRVLFHASQNVILISKLYVCKICGKKESYQAHHPDIISQTTKIVSTPFFLFLHSGVTKTLYETVINLSFSGVPFNEMVNYFQRQHGFYIGSHEECADVPSEKHKSPGRNLLVDIFVSDFRRRLTFY